MYELYKFHHFNKLWYFTRVLGLNFREGRRWWYKYFVAFLMSTFLISIGAWVFWDIQINKYTYGTFGSYMLHTVRSVVFMTASVSTVLCSVIKLNVEENILTTLKKVDHLISAQYEQGGFVTLNDKRFNNRKKAFSVQLVIILFVNILSIITDFMAHLFGYNWHIALRFVPFSLYIYQTSILVVQIFNFILSVKYRFYVLNEELVSFVKQKTSECRGPYLQRFFNSHRLLCDVVDLINNRFGIPLLGIIANGIVNQTNTVYYCLMYIRGKYTIPSEYAMYFVFLYAGQFCLHMAFGMVIVFSCEAAIQESSNSANTCFTLILKCYSPSSCNYSLRRELCELAQQVEDRNSTFDAAGLFKIDFDLLYAVFGIVISNAIIIIQFESK